MTIFPPKIGAGTWLRKKNHKNHRPSLNFFGLQSWFSRAISSWNNCFTMNLGHGKWDGLLSYIGNPDLGSYPVSVCFPGEGRKTHLLPRKLTANAPEKWWLEDRPFSLKWSLFWGHSFIFRGSTWWFRKFVWEFSIPESLGKDSRREASNPENIPVNWHRHGKSTIFIGVIRRERDFPWLC